MARLQGLFLFFALLVAVYGAATPKGYRHQFCKNHHGAIKKVRNSFAYPREFCLWYNSAKRIYAPFEHLPHTQVINACECIMETKPSRVPTDFTAPDDFAPVCDNALKRKLAGITYAQPKQFCKFWGNGAGAHFRRVGPFHKQGMTNMDTYNACACYDLFTYGNPTPSTTGDDSETSPSVTGGDYDSSATPTPSATDVDSESSATPTPSATDVDSEPSATPSSSATDVDSESSATPTPSATDFDSESSATPTPTPTPSSSSDDESSATPTPTPTSSADDFTSTTTTTTTTSSASPSASPSS